MITLKILLKRLGNDSSKRLTYISMNPSMNAPSLHLSRTVPEHKRIRYSQLRLSSHNLKIEKGRWCRTQKEQRLCERRSGIQTEEHVLLVCEKTRAIRIKFNINTTDISHLFTLEDEKVNNLVYDVMETMEP